MFYKHLLLKSASSVENTEYVSTIICSFIEM
mgnify:CR=1 FL=1